MPYKLKTKEQFNEELSNYIKNNPLILYEEGLIDNFSSSNISDLYKLFKDLDKSILDKDLYDKLVNILKTFQIDEKEIFPEVSDSFSPVTISKSDHLIRIANFIKNNYLDYINNADLNKISKDELYKLSLIVNKNFPSYFFTLIKKPNDNIQFGTDFIRKQFLSTIEHWHSHNLVDAEIENRDIVGAFYITAKKLAHELSIYIPGRVKSTKSAVSNINKEATDSLFSLYPSDITSGLSNEDIRTNFNLDNANTDFFGFTIVLANTDDTIHFDKNDPRSTEILALRKQRNKNVDFTHKLEDFLFNCDLDGIPISYVNLLQIKIDLLERLRDSSYDECSKEYEGTSFVKLLKDTVDKYNLELQKDNDNSSEHSQDDCLKELDEIYRLLDELKKRVHDKYQSKLLEMIIPDVLNDELFTDVLKVKSHFSKQVKKKNGFCSIYYVLETYDGRKIELQAQSQMRFEDSKNGASDHSNLPNKEIDIAHFFEPVDPNCKEEIFEEFLKILNTTPIATRNRLLKADDSSLTPIEVRLKRRLKIAENNVKIKDNYVINTNMLDGSVKSESYKMDVYLPIFAEYVSPRSMTVNSYHTRAHKSVAGYNKKSLISSFTEVLLKHDSTTCLAQKLIDKLDSLLPNDKNSISVNGITTRAKERFEKYAKMESTSISTENLSASNNILPAEQIADENFILDI